MNNSAGVQLGKEGLGKGGGDMGGSDMIYSRSQEGGQRQKETNRDIEPARRQTGQTEAREKERGRQIEGFNFHQYCTLCLSVVAFSSVVLISTCASVFIKSRATVKHKIHTGQLINNPLKTKQGRNSVFK